ncbi:MAG TPA: hypothetical protein VK644_02745 [Chitinophagaceae bacterium]|nr:hypothetical protein [Chitinophagaceae bacterium]
MIKILSIFSIAILCSLTCFSQIKKGSTSIGGEFYYYSADNNDQINQGNSKLRNASFNLSVGKAIRENSVVGISLLYSPSSQKNYQTGNNFSNQKNNTYGAGIFYRQYKKLAKDFYFFGEPALSFTTNHSTIDQVGGPQLANNRWSTALFRFAPGISYKVLRSFYLDVQIPQLLSLQYASYRERGPNSDVKRKEFSAYTSLNNTFLQNLGIGFRFIF